MSQQCYGRTKTGKCKVLPPLNKGSLSVFGYTTKISSNDRKHALLLAIDKLGATEVFRKLNALVVLNKHRPQLEKIYLSDRNFTKKYI